MLKFAYVIHLSRSKVSKGVNDNESTGSCALEGDSSPSNHKMKREAGNATHRQAWCQQLVTYESNIDPFI